MASLPDALRSADPAGEASSEESTRNAMIVKTNHSVYEFKDDLSQLRRTKEHKHASDIHDDGEWRDVASVRRYNGEEGIEVSESMFVDFTDGRWLISTPVTEIQWNAPGASTKNAQSD